MSEIRNFIGYGNNPPQFTWENNAKLAVQFVLNYLILHLFLKKRFQKKILLFKILYHPEK